MSKTQLLKNAANFIGKFLSEASATDVARASARIGTNIGTRGVRSVVATVKENPVTAALLLYEIGTEALPLLEELAAADSSAKEVIEVLRAGEIDDIDENTTIGDLGKFDDEFASISSAIGMLGSLPRLLAVRRAVMVSDEVLAAYVQTRNLGRHLR